MKPLITQFLSTSYYIPFHRSKFSSQYFDLEHKVLRRILRCIKTQLLAK
jgi:hypothetical protein